MDRWKCSCGERITIDPQEYLEIGTPMCCDREMERLPTLCEIQQEWIITDYGGWGDWVQVKHNGIPMARFRDFKDAENYRIQSIMKAWGEYG